jgi:hypothetical protein
MGNKGRTAFNGLGESVDVGYKASILDIAPSGA